MRISQAQFRARSAGAVIDSTHLCSTLLLCVYPHRPHCSVIYRFRPDTLRRHLSHYRPFYLFPINQ